MKIGKLYVKNIKAAREITIYGADLMELTGENKAGKSSTWGALGYALCGKKAVGELPLRRGKKRGEATVYLVHGEEGFTACETEDDADLIVTRKFTDKNQYTGGELTITTKDGAKWGQDMLNEIYDAAMFSPPDIASRLPGETKAAFRSRVAETFKELAGEEFCVALKAKDAEIKEAEETRKDANKAVARLGALERVPEAKSVDTDELMSQLRAAETHNREQEGRGNEIADHKRRIDALAKEAQELKEKIAKLNAQYSDLKSSIAYGCEAVDKLPRPEDRIDTAQLQDALASAGEQNAKAAAWQAFRAKLAVNKKLAEEANEAEEAVERLRDDRQELIAGVDLSVPGLTWDGEIVTLDGIPWSELSTGECWCASIDIVIHRQSLKPGRRLKAILIKDANQIDKKNFAAIVEHANSKGWQICAESIMPHSGDAIEIAEGEVVESEKPF